MIDHQMCFHHTRVKYGYMSSIDTLYAFLPPSRYLRGPPFGYLQGTSGRLFFYLRGASPSRYLQGAPLNFQPKAPTSTSVHEKVPSGVLLFHPACRAAPTQYLPLKAPQRYLGGTSSKRCLRGASDRERPRGTFTKDHPESTSVRYLRGTSTFKVP